MLRRRYSDPSNVVLCSPSNQDPLCLRLLPHFRMTASFRQMCISNPHEPARSQHLNLIGVVYETPLRGRTIGASFSHPSSHDIAPWVRPSPQMSNFGEYASYSHPASRFDYWRLNMTLFPPRLIGGDCTPVFDEYSCSISRSFYFTMVIESVKSIFAVLTRLWGQWRYKSGLPLLVQKEMQDWERVSRLTEARGIIEGRPWISNSPDIPAWAAAAQREVVTRLAAEVFQLYIHAHLLESAERCQVRPGILFYFPTAMSFVFVNIICAVNSENELQ